MRDENLESKLVIGLMSGTSVDGIDASLVEINPDLSVKVRASLIYEYPDNIKQQIHKLFSKEGTIQELCWMNFVIGEYFAQAALELLQIIGMKPEEVDLIGSHGQTVYHIPQEWQTNLFSMKSTLQIGEPSSIAERTGITTVADFRPRDIAAGGQGAPLVPFADKVLFKSDTIARGIQNIGGMANVTVLSPQVKPFAFDTGPGNVLIDYCSKLFFGADYDKDGIFASQGNIDEKWLESLMQEPYFNQEPPKTTGRELFSKDYAKRILTSAPENRYDVIATVTALTAKSIYKAYKDFILPKTRIDEIVLGGGGAYNPYLIGLLEEYFGDQVKILTHEDFGISSKFKEAIAFALLAYTTYYGIPNNVPACTGAKHNRVLGKIVPGNNG
ncbi:MAG TPA: anhydro-N-acetylmuramic acid kinase [Cyanobacteria bacterium UBA9579]|nr:anhydro-N-acetylmuramic acid kinase [Cyanobacteria bacterium UBA9579]